MVFLADSISLSKAEHKSEEHEGSGDEKSTGSLNRSLMLAPSAENNPDDKVHDKTRTIDLQTDSNDTIDPSIFGRQQV